MSRRPEALVVVGAAAGMGRWLTEHVFADLAWPGGVTLLDTTESAAVLDELRLPEGVAVTRAGVAAGGPVPGAAVELGRPATLACVAVPFVAMAEVAAWLVPALADDAVVCGVSALQAPVLAELRAPGRDLATFGVHPLFDASARTLDGQTVLLAPDERDRHADAHAWLAAVLHDGGGSAKVVPAPRHDLAMSYVQTMAHQALLTFVDAVTASGLDLEEVWELRTPLFESLFGLATRVIGERQQPTVADVQVVMAGERVAAELAAAAARTGAALRTGTTEAVEAHIAATRDRFSGTLFDTVQATAASAVAAAQAKRAELARRGRTGALVGVRPIGRPDALRVGRIVEVTPVTVTLEEVMVGPPGGAALLDGPGRRNAARIGANGRPQRTVFGLGHIDLVVGDELEHALDHWLAHIRRDVRFLVPESIAGGGVLAVVASHPATRDPELVSEVVRTGQRSVVVRLWIRADHDVEDMVEELRARVQETYVWPIGLSLAAAGRVDAVHYLGPAGTFSETAAAHAVASVGAPEAALVPMASFDEVLDALGPGHLGVLPITSSASGLVQRSVDALLRHGGDVTAGGVVDVPVRIDAYAPEGTQLADLRGATVLSHPQALAQCEGFVRRWGLQPEPCASTSDALRLVAADGGRMVALAPADKAAAYGLKVVEREVDDLSGSITRFLIVGRPDAFGSLVGGSDPTLRSLRIGSSAAAVTAGAATGQAAFDELLTTEEGACLWVTSRDDHHEPADGCRALGRAPWSPRTPVVRVEVTLNKG